LKIQPFQREYLATFLPACYRLTALSITLTSGENMYLNQMYGFTPVIGLFNFEQSLLALPTQLKQLFLSIHSGYLKKNSIDESSFSTALANRLPNLEALMIEGFMISKELGTVMVAKFPKLKICLSLNKAYPIYVAGFVFGNETGGWQWTNIGNRIQRVNKFGKFGPIWVKARQKYF
jgi:hypothetical protein